MHRLDEARRHDDQHDDLASSTWLEVSAAPDMTQRTCCRGARTSVHEGSVSARICARFLEPWFSGMNPARTGALGTLASGPPVPVRKDLKLKAF